MIAVLLCAGYATRMYPLTENFPKPLLPVAGKPVLDYLMEQLPALRGLGSVHVVTNARFFPRFEFWQSAWKRRPGLGSLEIRIHNDGSTDNANRLGACADLLWALRQIPEVSKMLVAAGDNVFRFKIEPLWDYFLKTDAHWILTLPETDREKLQRTGVPAFGKNDRVVRLYEKPSHPPSAWSCPAIYFFQKTVLPHLEAFLNSAEKKDAPGHFIDFLCRRDTVYAFKVNSTRFDIGSIADYHEADRRLKEEPLFI